MNFQNVIQQQAGFHAKSQKFWLFIKFSIFAHMANSNFFGNFLTIRFRSTLVLYEIFHIILNWCTYCKFFTLRGKSSVELNEFLNLSWLIAQDAASVDWNFEWWMNYWIFIKFWRNCNFLTFRVNPSSRELKKILNFIKSWTFYTFWQVFDFLHQIRPRVEWNFEFLPNSEFLPTFDVKLQIWPRVEWNIWSSSNLEIWCIFTYFSIFGKFLTFCVHSSLVLNEILHFHQILNILQILNCFVNFWCYSSDLA